MIIFRPRLTLLLTLLTFLLVLFFPSSVLADCCCDSGGYRVGDTCWGFTCFRCRDDGTGCCGNPENNCTEVHYNCECACPPEDDSCFSPGTKVLMSNGEKKDIEDVKVGDAVLSYDEEKGMSTVAQVLELESPVRRHLCQLSFADNSFLKLTNEHPVRTEEGWKSINPEAAYEESGLIIGKLEVGDKVIEYGEKEKEITDISCQSGIFQTYNLKKISKTHTFFADDVLVHNKNGGGGGGYRIVGRVTKDGVEQNYSSYSGKISSEDGKTCKELDDTGYRIGTWPSCDLEVVINMDTSWAPGYTCRWAFSDINGVSKGSGDDCSAEVRIGCGDEEWGNHLWFHLSPPPTPTPTGRIQGYKEVMPNCDTGEPASSQTISLDGGSGTTAQPYFLVGIPVGNHTVSTSVPSGYTAAYTYCYNRIDCHRCGGSANPDIIPTPGSSVTVDVPADGYVDLWWYYYPVCTAPTGLSESYTCAPSEGAATTCSLSWDRVAGAHHYNLSINAEGEDVPQCSAFSSRCSYAFSCTGGTTYNWHVYAVDEWGTWYESDHRSFQVPYVPAAPSSLTCSVDPVDFSSCASGESATVSLGWMDKSTNETSFNIYHQLNTDPSFSLLDTTPADDNAYSHQVNCNRDKHTYKVSSYNAMCGESSFSNPCSVQCVDTAPDKATSLSDGTFGDNQNILLSWKNISNWGLNCTGNTNKYRVYYCNTGTDCTLTSVPETNECLPIDNNSPTTGYFSCTLAGPLDWSSTYYWKVVTSNGSTLVSTAYSFFKITYPSAWWQTKTGDVYGNKIVSPIWRDVPEAQRYFSLVGPFGLQSGLVAAPNCLGAGCDFGEAKATETDFSGHSGLDANFTPLLNDYSYNQLAHLVDLAIKDNKQESYNSGVKVIESGTINKTDLVGASAGLYYYPPYGTGDMAVSLDNPFSVSANEKLIIFVEDDLNINRNITVTPGGFLAFIVKGNIKIAGGTEADPLTQVQGVYFADGSLTVESVGDTSEQQFNGQGIFVAKNGVSLERNFRDKRNATQPTEIFTFDPAYLFTAPRVFREKPYLWQQMIP